MPSTLRILCITDKLSLNIEENKSFQVSLNSVTQNRMQIRRPSNIISLGMCACKINQIFNKFIITIDLCMCRYQHKNHMQKLGTQRKN